MTEIVYCNIEKYLDTSWQEMLERIPANLHAELLRYKQHKDRLSRLLARIMLQDMLISKGYDPALLTHFQRDKHHRPFLPIPEDFSISHSGSYVLLAFSDHPVGIDIEKKEAIDWREYKSCFHTEESQHLDECIDPLTSFYEIWSKKEAALKLFGNGIVDGLDGFSCINDHFTYKNLEGNFYKLSVDEEYSAHLCSGLKNEGVRTRLFFVI